MKHFKSMLPFLKELHRTIILSLVMILVAGFLGSFSIAQVHSLIKAYEVRDRSIAEAQALIRSLRGDLEHAQKSRGSFEALQAGGALKPFAKQASLDQVDQLMQLGWVVPKSYALAAQSQLEGPQFASLSQHTPYRHSLSFEVSLPHELRLLALIDALTAQTLGGLASVEMCELARASGSEKTKDVVQPTLNARCSLNWYRFEAKSAAPVASPGAAPLSGNAKGLQMPTALNLQAQLGVKP